MEADLKRIFDVRLTDLYRGKITLREVLNYTHFILNDKHQYSYLKVAIDERNGWTIDHQLLADNWAAHTGKRHPLVPSVTADEVLETQPGAIDAIAEARAREDARQARLQAAPEHGAEDD